MASGQSRKRSKSARREREEPEKKRARHHHHHDEDKDKDKDRERRRSRSRSRSHRRTWEDEHRHSRHERHRSRERSDAKEGRRHEEVKVAGLPHGWRAYKSSSGDVFYYNSATRARQWARPGAPQAETAADTGSRAEKTGAPEASRDKAAAAAVSAVPLDLELDAETLARLASAPLVMPRSMYAGAQFTEEERAALARAGVDIDGPETTPAAATEVRAFAEPRMFVHCACVRCHSKVFDPQTALFLGPLSCEKNPVPSVRPLPPLSEVTPCP